ncbi:hypothetical protein INR49_009039 [Caranx melampygus]|nr:hypothetical protein INR49_009039 [Caranx melampygus]
MAAQTVFSVEMFPVGVSLMEDTQSLSDMPRNMLPAPQLVMLANVAAVTASEAGGGGGDGSAADEKEMMELKTVGSSYSDSEDESIIRYSYDNQNHREVCIIEYPESPGVSMEAAVVENEAEEEEEEGEEGEAEEGGVKAEDLSRRPQLRPSATTRTSQQDGKRKEGSGTVTEGVKKKKPFHCKPCHFQAQNEQEFVKHLSSHSVSKMMVVNRVEGRSKTKNKDAEVPEAQAPSGEEVDGGGDTGAMATTGDVKGLIRCERCGYNTNRYDHYIAHLKHHSKEGEDHRVFKCTLCPYTTVSQYHWRKHLRNHFPSKLHTCSQCERPFKCESCNYLAANQHEVTRHARQVHNGPKPLSCPYCDYKTADRSNFKKHVELHLNPRQFLCPLCKYAASKKCNLQYHIKSRHSGCNVSVDVSKVKLRVKKPSPDGADQSPDSRTSKLDNSSGVEEDFDMADREEDEAVDSSPINLSIRKSSRPTITQPVQSETVDKAQKKSTITSESEKPAKQKDKLDPEKKVTRQKKTEKVYENPAENTSSQIETMPAATTTTDGKVKRRVKKLLADKQTVQDAAEETEPQKDQVETERSGQPHKEKTVRQKVTKEEEKLKPEKEKEEQKNDGSGKENKSVNKSKKSGSKKSEKVTENPEDIQQKPESPEKNRKEKAAKEKAAKRKAVEALDLSRRSLSELPSKTRRLKACSQAASEDKSSDGTAMQDKSNGTTPVTQKKTRNSSKTAAGLQPTVDPAKDETSAGPSTEAAPAQLGDPKQTTNSGSGPAQTSAPPEETAVVEKTQASPTCSLSETTPSPAEDQPSPIFLKPTSPPSLVLPSQRIKPADPEDDEGIHSSHEGGSDISDSASEGSDDSGLNGNGAVSGKLPNDPETPTDEIPTPTELKSHMCIFCDRTFPLEVEYRRHLNRHLVNVYYMDTSKGQK